MCNKTNEKVMPKILVVEDEEIVRSNIAEILKAEGFEIAEAENGVQAIKELSRFYPDLIISDIMMPGMDGFELVNYIQNNPLTSSIPIILLTARAESTDIRRGMQFGADDYITKPFKANDLVGAVRTRLMKHENYNKKFEELKSNISMYIPHEFRTPLVSILGFADLIINSLDDLDKEEIKQMAVKVKSAGLRLYERVEKFLYFAELELIKTVSIPEEKFSVNDAFVSNLITMKFKGKIPSTLSYKIETANLNISEDYFARIVIELFDNAIKFTQENKQINVSGEKIKDEYIFSVEDNGIGMKEHQIKQIAAFTQFNREEFQQEGNGLGLAIVTNILKLFGGRMEIKSKPAEGCKVSVFIPIKSTN